MLLNSVIVILKLGLLGYNGLTFRCHIFGGSEGKRCPMKGVGVLKHIGGSEGLYG